MFWGRGSDRGDRRCLSVLEGLDDLDFGDKFAEDSLEAAASEGSTRRLLVALKRRGQRGPRQVEVAYDAASDVLFAIRFVDMPYGSSRLTLRLEPLPGPAAARQAVFFEHASHHDKTRPVERVRE